MKDKDKKVPVNSVLPESSVYTWHKFAVENKLNKQKALAELIRLGAKNSRIKVTTVKS
jgi:hypothetical protein